MNKGLFLLISLLLVITSVFFVIAAGQLTAFGAAPIFIAGPANFSNITIEALSLTANIVGNNGTTNVTWFAESGGTNYTILTLNSANTTNGTTTTFVAWSTVPHGYINLSILATNNTQYGGNQTYGNVSIGCEAVLGTNAGAIGGCNLFLRKLLNDTDVSVVAPTTGQNISGSFDFKANLTVNNLGHNGTIVTNTTWFISNASGNTTIGTNHAIDSLNVTNNTLDAGASVVDGTYDVYVRVTNNSVFNHNFTIKVGNVVIDNGKPSTTITFSDSDAKIITRGENKVTCANSDATSGIDASQNTIEVTKPNGDVSTFTNTLEKTFKDLDTAQTGEYTIACKATDYSGNIQSVTKKLQVRARTSGVSTSGTDGVSFDYDLNTKDSVTASGREGTIKEFTLDGTTKHEIEFKTVTGSSVTLVFRSEPVEIALAIGSSKEVDLNGDTKPDIKATLINIVNGRATLAIDRLEGAVMIGEAPEPSQPTQSGTGTQPTEDTGAGEGTSGTTWIVIVIIIVVIIGGYFLFKGGKGKGKKGQIKFSRSELKPRA